MAHTLFMSTTTRRTSSGSAIKLDVILASLLLNAGILLALVTWTTADRPDFFSGISNEQLRAAASILAIGVPIAIVAAGASRLSARLSVDLGTGTLLALIAALSAIFTTAAVLHAVLPWDSFTLMRLLHALTNGATIFLIARVLVRRARQHPDWISLTGTIFAVGLLPLGLLSLAVDALTYFDLPVGDPPLTGVNPADALLAALYLTALLPALFFGQALLRAESVHYRPIERRFVEFFAAFGVGSLAATVVPFATTRLYDSLQTCTNEYVCTRPPGEWIVIGLLTGLTAWRLIRGAEGAKQPLLWIGALPPLVTTAIAINWYLPAWLGGLPIAGALIAFGGLLLLRRATMEPAPRSRRAAKRR
jgi:hypothetical protein